jgi:hypothetical protein
MVAVHSRHAYPCEGMYRIFEVVQSIGRCFGRQFIPSRSLSQHRSSDSNQSSRISSRGSAKDRLCHDETSIVV